MNHPQPNGIPFLAAQNKKPAFNEDGWKNFMTGMGRHGRDSTRSIQSTDNAYLPVAELTAVYKSDGIAQRIINAVADDMTRAGWTVPQDEDEVFKQELQTLSAKKILNQALIWRRLYGGAIVVADFVGGGLWEEPLNLTSTSQPKLRSLRVYPSARIDVTEDDIVDDPDSPYFEEVEVFKIRMRKTSYLRVHSSRCLVFKGVRYADLVQGEMSHIETRYWGSSVLQSGYDYLKLLGALLQGLGVLGQEFSVGKYTLSNLEDMVAEGNYAALQKRMELIAVTKSVINSVLLGESEEYSRDNVSFTGVDSLLDRFIQVVSGATGIPVTRLFGISPAGLNATGHSDLRNYYDSVESEQETDFLNQVHQLMQWVNMSMGYPVDAEELTVTFNPVWTPSQAEELKMKKEQAETDHIYIQDGVLSNTEVRQQRFGGDYSYDTVVDPKSEGFKPEEGLDELAQKLVGGKEKEAEEKAKIKAEEE